MRIASQGSTFNFIDLASELRIPPFSTFYFIEPYSNLLGRVGFKLSTKKDEEKYSYSKLSLNLPEIGATILLVGGLIMMPIPAVSVTTAALIAMLFTTF